MNRLPSSLVLGMAFSLVLGAPVHASPTVTVAEELPVNLGWRTWSSTSDGGWEFSTQVNRRAGALPKGAHLHFDGVSATGRTAESTILVLPVKTLNRASVLPAKVGSLRRPFAPGKATLRVPFAASTASVAVSYCEDAGHLAVQK